MSPNQFGAVTGLSPKALRLYDEQGLLRPAFVDPATGYRRYTAAQVTIAARIALLRRAGIGLGEIERFLASPSSDTVRKWQRAHDAETVERRRMLEELAHSLGLDSQSQSRDRAMTLTVTIRPISSRDELDGVFDLLGAQFQPRFDRSDGSRFDELARAFPDQLSMMLVAEQNGSPIGGALGFKTDEAAATLRVLAVVRPWRRQGVGRALLRAFEGGSRLLGVERVSLGANEEVGFYVRHGYQTMLLAQWVYDAAGYEREVSALLAGPLNGADHSRETFNSVPQLFASLDEPTPAVLAEVGDLAPGAHVGYCMTRRLAHTSQGDDNGSRV
jgi:DNA-binding transcriptional MerR regulator